MAHARFLVADVHDGLATLADGSVDLVVTSPPFLALRSYLPSDHELKAKEIGSEATPGAYLDVLLDVVEECARVLAPHGSIAIELGDTYAGSGGENHLWDSGYSGFVHGRNTKKPIGQGMKRGSEGWPLDKSKTCIPQLFAIALAYGFNPLTGRQTDRWRVRNVVAWARPNPPVGRDGDKFRPATSYLTVACKARDRYWDGDAVRTEQTDTRPRNTNGPKSLAATAEIQSKWETRTTNPAGAPLLDYWIIPTQPYKGAHYATYPEDLVIPLIESMCPRRVCRVCGEPSRRIVGEPSYAVRGGDEPQPIVAARGATGGSSIAGLMIGTSSGVTRVSETLGWSDCGCECPRGCGQSLCVHRFRPGLVLDCFGGSGTTAAVAVGHGRDCVLIDLDERNAELARERVGLFLTVEHLESREGVA